MQAKVIEDKRKYKLDDTKRVEWLTPLQARIFNRSRGDNRKWREAPGVPDSAVTTRPPIPTGRLRQQLSAEGYAADEKWYAAQMNQTKPETPAVRKDDGMAKDKKATKEIKAPKAEKRAKKAPKEKSEGRGKFEGIGRTVWLYYLASKGCSWQRGLKVLEKMGIPTTEANARLCCTTNTDSKYAKRIKLVIPVLTKSQKAALNAIAEEVPETEEPEAGKPRAKKKKPKAAPAEETVETGDSEETGDEPSDEDREAAVDDE